VRTCKIKDILPRYYVGVEEFDRPFTQIDMLAEDIKARGIQQPIIVDRNLRLISGWRRLEAARWIGMKEVPFIAGDFYTVIAAIREEQANADPAFTVEMRALDKLKMINTLRILGEGERIKRRLQITHRAGKTRHGKGDQAPVPQPSTEEAIASVMRYEPASAYKIWGMMASHCLGAVHGKFGPHAKANEEAALEAMRIHQIGLDGHGPHCGAHATWEIYRKLSTKVEPQDMRTWETGIAAIQQQLEHLHLLAEQLHTPPRELTVEQAVLWGDQISSQLKPFRVLAGKLRGLNKGENP